VAWGEARSDACCAAILAACGLLLPFAAQGQEASPVSPFVEEKIVHDSNIFKLSKSVDPAPLVGRPDRSDTYYVTSGGLNLDLLAGRQKFQGHLSVNDTRYQRFRALNYTGHDLRADWLWQIGNDASGELGYTQSASLASFADILGTAHDRLKLQHAFVNGTYRITPSWRIFGGADAYQQRNSDAPRRVNDVDIDNGELALRYVSAAEASIGVSVRAENGRFPVRQPVGAALIDNAYRQNRAGLVAELPITVASRVSGRIDRVSRRYEQVSARDFDGTTARLQYDWKPTEKIGLVAIAQRDISPFEYVRSSFVMINGVTLRPTYSVTASIDLAGTFDVSRREYLGDPSVGLGLAPRRTDHVRSAGLLLTYRPLRTVTIQLNAQHEQRTSNIAFGDYSANVAYLSARYAF